MTGTAAATPSATHQCPARSCKRQVGTNLLMCPQHWWMVPRALRHAVWVAWKAGQGAGSPAHRAAIRAAINAVNKRVGDG